MNYLKNVKFEIEFEIYNDTEEDSIYKIKTYKLTETSKGTGENYPYRDQKNAEDPDFINYEPRYFKSTINYDDFINSTFRFQILQNSEEMLINENDTYSPYMQLSNFTSVRYQIMECTLGEYIIK